MMNEDSRHGYYNKAKQEGGMGTGTINIDKFSTSRQWPGFRNPRIVRVSRSFGGKDRHSKVCTIRGLRDRRIRLSVQTAVQLYELQERLGVSQPSKVIDWLLEATKYDIEKLPPLQIPQGFPQFHQYQIQTLLPQHREYSSSLSLHSCLEKGKWIKENHEDGISGQNQKLLNNGMGYINNNNNNSNISNNPYYHSEPESLSLSQFGNHGCGLLFPSQVEYSQFSSCLPVVPLPVPPPPANSSQLLFYPPPSSSSAAAAAASVPSFFAPLQNNIATSAGEESDPRGQLLFNHVQFLSSSSNSSQVAVPPPNVSCLHSLNSPLKPFSSKLLDSDNNNNPSPSPDKGSTR